MFSCYFCLKKYKYKCGLSTHIKTCTQNPDRKENGFSCDYCGEKVKFTRDKVRHERKCVLNPNTPKPKPKPKPCDYCGRDFKTQGSRNGHIGYCKLNPNRTVPYSTNKKGEDHPRYGKKGRNGAMAGYVVSEETRKKLSESAKKQVWTSEKRQKKSLIMREVARKYPESYRHGNLNGRTKIYEYKGFKVRGTWELEVAKYLSEKDVKWTNKVKPFDYIWNGKTHSYYPDFYLEDYDTYIEVKGYKTERDEAKWVSIPNLVVIMKSEINAIKKQQYNIFDYISDPRFESENAH